jgi:hypothetical protein
VQGVDYPYGAQRGSIAAANPLATLTPSFEPVPAAADASGLSRKTKVWRRVLIPSFGDLFFIALLAWLFICGSYGWKALLMDGDTGWHIRTGQYILQHHAVPTQDLFSFSRPGAQWFAWEWLSDVLYALLFRAGGLKAIVLLAGVLITGCATVILRYSLWRGANPLLATFTTLLAVGGSSMHFLARPHLFTFALLPICIWIVEADRRKTSRWIWILIPLGAVWINLHGGYFLFLALLAALVAGTLVEEWLAGGRWIRSGRYFVLFVGCSASSLLNPYGIALHVHVFEYLRSDWIRNLIQEFQAPSFRTEGQLQFEVLLLIGLVATGSLLQRRQVTEALWLVFLAHSSLISVRHAPIYCAVAAPLIAEQMSGWWRSWMSSRGKSSIGRIVQQVGEDLLPAFRRTSVWPVAVVLALVVLDAPLKWPSDFPAEGFPTVMVHQNAALLQSDRLLTTDQWADYLIYSFYPRQKVFVDGRSDFYGEALGNEYLHLLQGAYDWQGILKRHGFEVVLVPANWPLAEMMKLDRSWQVVQDDSRAILFRRRRERAVGN